MIGEFFSLPTAHRSLQIAILSLELLGVVLVLVELGRQSGLWGMGLGLTLMAIALLIERQRHTLIQMGDGGGIDLNGDRQPPSPKQPPIIESLREFDQFREFVDRMPVPTFIKDRDSVTVYVNPYYESIFGSGWVGKSVWDYFPKSVAQRMVEDDRNALEAGITQVTEAVPVPDGSGRMFQTLKFPLYQEGQPRFLAGFGVDVTDRKLAEATVARINTQLALSNTELALRHRNTELLLQMSNALQACPTLDAVATTIGQFMEQLFPQYGGLVALAIPDQQNFQVITTWGLLTPIMNMATVPCQNCWEWHWNPLGDRQPVLAAEGCSHWQQPGVGDYVCLPIYSTHAAMGYPFDQIRGVLHLYQPNGNAIAEAALQLAQTTITSINLTLINMELRQALHEQSIRDPLTHLFNRRYLTETLNRELARAIRESTPISVIMIDVDYFKRLNDTYGHAAGDRVLQALAHLLRSHIRQGDIACRYGGEEFVVVLPTAAVEIAYERAEQIRLAFAALPITHDQRTLRATLSAGVAAFPDHGDTDESLLRSADDALYQAKARGRNQAIVSLVSG